MGARFPGRQAGLAQFPPILMMALRFDMVAAVLVPFVGIPRGRLAEIAVLPVTFGLIHPSPMVTGLAHADVAIAGYK